jgi:hypothetical protein
MYGIYNNTFISYAFSSYILIEIYMDEKPWKYMKILIENFEGLKVIKITDEVLV